MKVDIEKMLKTNAKPFNKDAADKCIHGLKTTTQELIKTRSELEQKYNALINKQK